MLKHSCVFMDVIYRLDVNVNLPAPVSEDNVWHSEPENQLPGRHMSSDSGITFCLISKSFCCIIKHLLPCFDVFYVR